MNPSYNIQYFFNNSNNIFKERKRKKFTKRQNKYETDGDMLCNSYPRAMTMAKLELPTIMHFSGCECSYG